VSFSEQGDKKMSTYKPWREVAIPHSDVLEGSFQQSEFAADLSAVHSGKATREYQDAQAFFQRTFITEGMRLLLTSVANRLNKKGGDPVIQLQTSFGGGKTHTMLAVYHLATRKCPLHDLAGIGSLLDNAGLLDVPKARVAVLDGNQLAPGQPRKKGSTTVRTLWGELAWQLGDNTPVLYEKIKSSDEQGTSPGKELLREILEAAAPCVILIDELVAFIRQFEEGKSYPAGTFDSNLSFLQALTEAIKLVPNAIMLASLPESDVEAGSSHGLSVLKTVEKTVGRVQALWKPVATEEAFEIVRRRLFEDVVDTNARDAACEAFAEAYRSIGSGLPSETQEARYLTRLQQAYPIHPEIFDRLYEDWSHLQNFQRTRGVLKLMAKVIHRLWQDNNQDLLILPGSLPLYDGSCRAELTQHLIQGWEPVIEQDIDGERSETVALEAKETRFGMIMAARRVARTIFFGTAPSSGNMNSNMRGQDRGRVLLGCIQPGQSAATYVDALGRLVDRLHYLNATGDKSLESTRFWFDTRANLRREMEDRKCRFEEKKEVKDRITSELKVITAGPGLFDGVHIFANHSDVPDDDALRLIMLQPSKTFSKSDQQAVITEAKEYLKNNGTKPRHRANRLIFVAADSTAYPRVIEQTRTVLAWDSIMYDIKARRLVVDRLQEDQALKAQKGAQGGLESTYRECFKWLLCPIQETPTNNEVKFEDFPIPTSGMAFGKAIEQICKDNDLVITTWAAIHLKAWLKDLYWKGDARAVLAKMFWDDSTKYLYLPRLRNESVLNQAIHSGSGSRDFFGTALGKDGSKYVGFQFGKAIISSDTNLLVIDPEEATYYEREIAEMIPKPSSQPTGVFERPLVGGGAGGPIPVSTPSLLTKMHAFHGSVRITQAAFKMKLTDIADEVLVHLAADPDVELEITLEISATFSKGASKETMRTVDANAGSLGFNVKEWEE
jgi:predicted AAA+ superfamily ATPase